MLNVLSLFSGIGAFEKALKRENIAFNLVNFCEIDKYACKAYAAVHGVSEDLNLKDVTKIDTSTLKDVDLITYGFPCQDISNAGKQAGFTNENGELTRSGLFFEALRIIKDLQPKYAIAENVKALTSKKFENEFKLVLDSLSAVGYNNYYQVLNAKDYGIPQNRERIFIISIRKDVDNGSFVFSDKMPLNIRLKDILEDNVDEKFYLSNEQIDKIKNSNFNQEFKRIQTKDVCDTLLARDYKDPKCVRVGGLYDTEKSRHQAGAIYDANGISPALDTCQGGNRMPQIVCNTERMTKQAYETLQENECKAGDVINPFNKKVVNNGLCPTLTTRPEGFKTANLIVTEKATAAAMQGRDKRVIEPIDLVSYDTKEKHYNVKQATKRGFIECKVDGVADLSFPTSKYRRGRVQGNGEIVPTLTAESMNIHRLTHDFRIRKLTPKECWRLMGFDDDDFYKAQALGISNSQLYKQAGNSIVVNVLQAIFRNLFNNI